MDVPKSRRSGSSRKKSLKPAHTYTSYLAYKQDHEPNVGDGTFVSQHALARFEAAKPIHEAKSQPKPEMARLYMCVREAVAQATLLVSYSRANAPTNAEQVVGCFARLSVYLDHLKSMSNTPKLLAKWPKSPGYTFGVIARWSALEAAWSVAESAHTGAQIGGQFATKMFLSDPRLQMAMAYPPDELVTQWANGALQELRDRTLPPTVVWSIPGYLQREREAIQYHLIEEYEETITPKTQDAQSSTIGPPRSVPEADLRAQLGLLNRVEQNCIQALFEHEKIGPDAENAPSSETISKWAGYPCDTTFKTALSSVVKAGFLGNHKQYGKRGGYFLTPKGKQAGALLPL